MRCIIDGHNLIPHISGLSLSDLNDEVKLIKILQQYANRTRSIIEVYFDKAPATKARVEGHGNVQAHFVHVDSSADQAIKSRIRELGKSAKNWTVVSSDREVLAEARSWKTKIMRSSDFVKLLQPKAHLTISDNDKDDQPEVSEDEVDFWLDQFNRG
jgi:predicted RNA-binding protein with PIN domain